MRNIRLAVSYDGTCYSGFQSQPSSNTIQDKLETAIFALTGEHVKLIGSGRTDAGVHARRQVINFLTKSSIPIERWGLALNTRLPNDIIIIKADEVALSFHATKHAKSKTYCYRIRYSRTPDVFQRRFEYHYYGHLNIAAMKRAIPQIVGTHDYTSFCSARSVKESHIRTIYDVRLEFNPEPHGMRDVEGEIRIFITGNGFLYNMVRIIVGTLIRIGEGKITEDLQSILLSKNREKAGPTAMAHGLTLWDVEYEDRT